MEFEECAKTAVFAQRVIIIPAIDHAYSPFSECTDRIQAQDKKLLPHKIYCKLQSVFICLLQLVEDHDVDKDFNCITIQNHGINSSVAKCLPEVAVVTVV